MQCVCRCRHNTVPFIYLFIIHNVHMHVYVYKLIQRENEMRSISCERMHSQHKTTIKMRIELNWKIASQCTNFFLLLIALIMSLDLRIICFKCKSNFRFNDEEIAFNIGIYSFFLSLFIKFKLDIELFSARYFNKFDACLGSER